MALIAIIGRGHSGTRIMSRTLLESGVYKGAQLNPSYDLVPAEEMYEACRIMARYVVHRGGVDWDFSKLHTMPIDAAFTRLVESYLSSVLSSDAERRGWKLPETTLVFPWMVRLFPETKYIGWVRDPRDSIMGRHITDDLSEFGVPYSLTKDGREMRAISWRYQLEIVKATPKPKYWCSVRVEDFCVKQNETMGRLEEFLGFPLSKIPVTADPIGRWKSDTEKHDFDFLQEPMEELGYV